MKGEPTRRDLTEATIENLGDVWEAERGRRRPESVRRITVADAVVDLNTTGLGLPARLIGELGLSEYGQKPVGTCTGAGTTRPYGPVRLTIQGRDMTIDVAALPDEAAVRIGRIALTFLDFVVDPRSGRLIGNPAHGGEQMFEMFSIGDESV